MQPKTRFQNAPPLQKIEKNMYSSLIMSFHREKKTLHGLSLNALLVAAVALHQLCFLAELLDNLLYPY